MRRSSPFSSTTSHYHAPSDGNRRSSVSATTTRRSASSVAPQPAPAPPVGQTAGGSGPPLPPGQNRGWGAPASIVNAHRFIFDSRDRGAPERLQILGDRNGVWRCRTIFNCTEACPRGIHVTEAIEEVKRAIVYNSNEVE